MNIKFLSVIGILCWISVGSGAASLAENAKIGNPHEPEQNFNKIKRKFSNNNRILQDEKTKTLIPDNFDIDQDLEGSGADDLDLDDEDHDLDEYDYDDDDYYDDDLDEEGSGNDEDLILPVEKDENSVKLKPDSNDNDDDNNDFVFEDDFTKKNKDNKIDEKDLLYEYYNDLIYDDDDDDDDYYIDDEDLKVIDQDLGSVSGRGNGENFVKSEDNVIVDSIEIDQNTGAAGGGILGGYAFRPAYVFLMLASALVSFAFFTLIFILCRRSMFQPQQKSVFTMSGNAGYGLVPTKSSSPIVKNPNKTPKPTKDMLNLNYVPPPQMSTSTVEMGHTDTQKPLLT